MSRKIISESIPKAIADEVRKKMGITSQMRVADIAAEVAKIRLGCPIQVTCRIGASGQWERPAEWANLDLLPKEDNIIYLTIDNSGRIDDAHLSVAMTTASGQYTAEVGNVVDGVFVGGAAMYYNSGATCLISNWGDVSYPVVKLKAVGGFTNMDFKAATINGHTYVARYNAVVEASGHVGKYSGGIYGTYWLERDSRVIGVANGAVMANTWSLCYSLQSLDVSGWDTSNWSVSSLANTWSLCYSLQSLDVSGWDTSNWSVNSLVYTWQNCYSLQSLDLSGWDTSNWSVTSKDLYRTFNGCQSLVYLDISSFDISKFTSFYNSSYPTWCGRMLQTLIFGENNNGKVITTTNWQLDNSVVLSRQSIINIFNALANITTARTLKLGNENLGKMTTEEKAIATSKGWTLA